MLRVVVAVALGAALLGASMPAIDTSRVDHAEARVGAEIDGLAGTAERLRARNDPSPPGVPGARRTVTLHLPGPSWGSASLDYLSIPGPPTGAEMADHTTVAWRVEGGRRVSRRLSVPLVGPGDGLTIEGGGSRRIVLELTRREGTPVVLARRPEFKSDSEASVLHAPAEFDSHDVPVAGSR